MKRNAAVFSQHYDKMLSDFFFVVVVFLVAPEYLVLQYNICW